MSDHWTQAVSNMKIAIKKNNYYDFLLNFTPDDDTGYAWTQNEEFKQISKFLERETNSDGHSGASFAVCLRTSIQDLQSEMNNETKKPIIAEICNVELQEYQEATIVYDLSVTPYRS